MYDFKMKFFLKILEQFSIKVKNKIAKIGINLNFLIFNFYLFLKTKAEVNRI